MGAIAVADCRAIEVGAMQGIPGIRPPRLDGHRAGEWQPKGSAIAREHRGSLAGEFGAGEWEGEGLKTGWAGCAGNGGIPAERLPRSAGLVACATGLDFGVLD